MNILAKTLTLRNWAPDLKRAWKRFKACQWTPKCVFNSYQNIYPQSTSTRLMVWQLLGTYLLLIPLFNLSYFIFWIWQIHRLSVNPDEIFVSFDVVSLFTCIPSNLAVEVLKERLYSNSSLSERTNLSIENIIKLLK